VFQANQVRDVGNCLSVCLPCDSAAAHQSIAVWNIQITRAKAEEDLQTYRQEIVSLGQMIARLKAMIAHPETDEDCYELKRALNKPAEECVIAKQEAISDYERNVAEHQSVIDRGIDAYIGEYLSTEAKDREYLKAHWAKFPDQDISDRQLGPPGPGTGPVIGSYTALKTCDATEHNVVIIGLQWSFISYI
jgi:hypothetical protein